MPKRKKKKQEPTVPVYTKPSEGRYYWCVNCGHHGDYGKVRKRNLNCEVCDYEDITIWTQEEINDPWLDDITVDRFRTKDSIENAPPWHEEVMKAVEEAKQLLSSTGTEPKDKGKSLQDKLAEIRKL